METLGLLVGPRMESGREEARARSAASRRVPGLAPGGSCGQGQISPPRNVARDASRGTARWAGVAAET